MLRIRLLRVGKKNSPSFRLVVTPKRTASQTGRFLENLGFYNPREHSMKLKKERIQYWISQGAQPSDTAHNMLIAEGIIEGKKIAVHSIAKKQESDEASKKTEGNANSAKATEVAKGADDHPTKLGPQHEVPAETAKDTSQSADVSQDAEKRDGEQDQEKESAKAPEAASEVPKEASGEAKAT